MNRTFKIIGILALIFIIVVSVALDGSESVLTRAIALNSVFTGLVTLTGFMFTARTFITFKLNDVVYGKETYRDRVEALQAEGAYKKALYDPLKVLDTRIGESCLWCSCTLLSVLLFSFLPRVWSTMGVSLWDSFKGCTVAKLPFAIAFPWRFLVYQIATMILFTLVFFIIFEVFSTIRSVNQNIGAIIGEWEKQYTQEKADAKAKAGKQ